MKFTKHANSGHWGAAPPGPQLGERQPQLENEVLTVPVTPLLVFPVPHWDGLTVLSPDLILLILTFQQHREVSGWKWLVWSL